MRFVVCERKNGCAPPCHSGAVRVRTLRYQANVKRDDRYRRRGSAILYPAVCKRIHPDSREK
ncbi:hypothetical protein ARMGADRAFT_1014884 [Armillaria gallica]|uniref:Uncharacterized protein n=1 Tax=Armillaria gallica TaxID=47427 RepID=A0A2H3DMH1_ARMGA|nr:hypothetical protein ARMGADRAFT_1014884 [Armillaria gallica]